MIHYWNGSAWTAIGASKSCDVSIQVDTQEVASREHGGWKEYMTKKAGWTMNTNGLVVKDLGLVLHTRMYDLMTNRTLLTVTFRANAPFKNRNRVQFNGMEWTGKAYITSMQMTGTKGEISTWQLSLQGTGPLTDRAWNDETVPVDQVDDASDTE